MKRLLIVLILTGLAVSPAMAEFFIAPNGATLPDGAVNYVVSPPSPGVGHMAGSPLLVHPGIPYMSRLYWASYPMTMAPVIPPTGPSDPWAESVQTTPGTEANIPTRSR